MKSTTRSTPEVWVRSTFGGMFSEAESETRRRLYAEVSELESDPKLGAISAEEFASEFLVAEINLFVALAAKLNPLAADLVPLVKREYLSHLSPGMRMKFEKADGPYSVRVREYGIRGIWPYTAVAEMFLERLGCRPVPVLAKRVELALAMLGELWNMEALRFISE